MSLPLFMLLSQYGAAIYVPFRLRADFIFMSRKNMIGTDVLVSLCHFCSCSVGVSIRMFHTNVSKMVKLPIHE